MWKRIIVRSFGTPEVLQVESLAKFYPKKDQILVRVMAFGINPVETYIRSGIYDTSPTLPYTPGTDAAGIIESVGESVSPESFTIGMRVWLTNSITGTYAQYCLCNPADVHPLPDTFTFEQGAAIGIPYRTAFRALNNFAQARSGESVLVHGATGGVGIAALQFARWHGLTPIIASTSSKDAAVHNILTASGATQIIEHGALDESSKVDIIIENLADKNLGKDLKSINRSGRVIIVGSRGETTVNPRDLMRSEGTVRGLVGHGSPEEKAQIDAAIQAGLGSGQLNPVVGHVFKLGEISAAHEEVINHSRGTNGKIVVLPWSD